MVWEGLFDVKGGFQQQEVYVPFDNFYPTAIGISMWPWKWLVPFGGLNMSEISNIGYQYCIFEYISWFFFYIVATENYKPGYFEFHHKDIKVYKKNMI